MQNPHTFARAVAKALAANAPPASPAPPQLPPPAATEPDEPTVYQAIEICFAHCFSELAALRARITELEKKPAARILDATGAVVKHG
jgi:hypothetical protein